MPLIDSRVLGIWVAIGLIGLGFLLVGPALVSSWRVNQAGVILNRHLQTNDREAILSALAVLGAPGADPGASYWRTYGAAAVRRPSDEAFEHLRTAQAREGLDRIGELWLGEVAAATGHWEEARQAYSKVDVANLLVERADAAMKADKADTAMRWYGVAAASLRAARERDSRRSTSDRGLYAGGTAPEADETRAPGGLAILLLRIGRGFLALGHPEEAVPVLNPALAEMKLDPPGVRERQAIQFALAQALAQSSLAEDQRSRTVETAAGRPAGSAPPQIESRARELVLAAVELDDTGWAEVQAGRVMAFLGDRVSAIRRMRAAISLDPTLVEAYLVLGALHETAGLPNLARDVYEQGLEHVSSSQQLQVSWALTSAKTLPAGEALPRLEKVAETESRDPYLFATLGDTYLELGRETEGIAAYREGLRRAPGARPLLDRLKSLDRGYWRSR